jgi:hypothetical protein
MGRSNSVNSLFIIAEVEDRRMMLLTWGHSQYIVPKVLAIRMMSDAGHGSVDAFSTIKDLTEHPRGFVRPRLFRMPARYSVCPPDAL